jgi:hypothetical protein
MRFAPIMDKNSDRCKSATTYYLTWCTKNITMFPVQVLIANPSLGWTRSGGATEGKHDVTKRSPFW